MNEIRREAQDAKPRATPQPWPAQGSLHELTRRKMPDTGPCLNLMLGKNAFKSPKPFYLLDQCKLQKDLVHFRCRIWLQGVGWGFCMTHERHPVHLG